MQGTFSMTPAGMDRGRAYRLNLLFGCLSLFLHYFVLEGMGRMRVGDNSLTVPRYGGVLVAPDQLRQVFNDTDQDVLWLIIGAPEELEFIQGSKSKTDLSVFYPTDPTQLPGELTGVTWPPADSTSASAPKSIH